MNVAWIEAAVGALALWAAWKTLPRPPSLDAERLFKRTLATVLRGDAEAAGGELADWVASLEGVPYHPLARDTERRLQDPGSATIPTPPREGERALVDRLANCDTPEARWDLLFRADPRGHASLLEDPALLGAAYDPTTRFGPDATWDAVADWSAPLQEGLGRRLSHLVFVDATALFGDHGNAALPGLRSAPLGPSLRNSAEPLLESPADRIVAVVRGHHMPALLDELLEDPALVDRVLGVVSLGGAVAPDPKAWQAQFQHAALEPEVQRALLFVSLIDIDVHAPLDRSWVGQTFVEPPLPDTGRRSIECVDLGPLDLARVAPHALVRSLLVLLGTLVAR